MADLTSQLWLQMEKASTLNELQRQSHFRTRPHTHTHTHEVLQAAPARLHPAEQDPTRDYRPLLRIRDLWFSPSLCAESEILALPNSLEGKGIRTTAVLAFHLMVWDSMGVNLTPVVGHRQKGFLLSSLRLWTCPGLSPTDDTVETAVCAHSNNTRVNGRACLTLPGEPGWVQLEEPRRPKWDSAPYWWNVAGKSWQERNVFRTAMRGLAEMTVQ